MATENEDAKPADDAEIIAEARKLVEDWNAYDDENRQAYLDSMRFLYVDQWPAKLRQARESSGRPCMTIDRTSQHVKQVTNDQRQNKPAVRVLPVDEDADEDTAEVFADLIRNIEHVSDADVAYQVAGDCQVGGGFGYFRILNEQYDEEQNLQQLCIKPIHNPLAVAMEPGSVCPVGSDSTRWVLYEDLPRREFKRLYPNAETESAQIGVDPVWVNETTVRVAEYWRIDTVGGKRVVKWWKLGGAEILSRGEWAGKYIPIVRVPGEEQWIEGKRYARSLTSRLMDQNRMLNYVRTVQAEKAAMAPKAKWMVVEGQIDGYASVWQDANNSNDAVLTYRAVDVDGKPAPPPQRIAPDYVDTALNALSGELIEDMKAATGQYNQSLGQGGQATSGIAIGRLQQQGDRATFHFVDNMAHAIKHCGRILVDAIPKYYDTERVLRVLGEDGTPRSVQIGPVPQEEQQIEDTGQRIEAIYALGVGTYDVAVSVGPSFATRKQEAFAAFTQMIQAAPQLWQVAGDIIARSMDAPGADELAERLKKTIDPKLLDDGANPEQQQLKQMQEMVQKAVEHIAQLEQQAQQLAEENQQLKEKASDAVIKANASIEAERMKQAGNTERKQMEVSASMAQAGTAPQDFAVLLEAVARLTEMVEAQQSHLSALIPAPQPQM